MQVKKSASESRQHSAKTGNSRKPVRKKTGTKTSVKNTAARKPAGSKGSTTRKPASAKKSGSAKTEKKKPAAKKSTVKKKPALKSSPAKSAGTPLKKKAAAKKAAAKKAAVGGTVSPPVESYTGKKPYLFCSYAHSDMKEVFKLIKKIHEMGYRVWYDEGITPGIEWPEAIGKALLGCDQYLIFMTPRSIASRNVRNEINLAYSEKKDLLVVFLEQTRLSGGMRLLLGTVHCIKKYEMTDNSFYLTLNKVLNSNIKT